MKISTEIGSAAKLVGEQKAVEYVAKAGFDAWDFSMFDMVNYDWVTHKGTIADHPLNKSNYLAFARELRQIGNDLGIHCNQSHAPFPVNDQAVLDCLKRAIEATAEAGGSICVVHPDNNSTPQQNAEFYHSLLPFAKGCGVKLATENMWNWDNENRCVCAAACSSPESFVSHIDTVNDSFLVACLDIGHAEMQGAKTSAVKMIHALNHRLCALHIHDNDLINDSHQLPFTMQIDFAAVARALKDINYKGYLTLEADKYLHSFTAETCFNGVCNMAESMQRFRELYLSL
ncbi:MAG: sugar phosphate isomerase/epimerase [Clostridia bacterium]|nr:sugar phosphate isomerase/epimerase [Clostridia bacterium]